MNEVGEGRLWGSDSLILKLPAVNIELSGLSSRQHRTLKESYLNFFASSRQFLTDVISCNAVRLLNNPALSINELTVDGQYAPKKTRGEQAGSFTVSGINFEANFSLNKNEAYSSLGVVREQELTYANVIENFLRIISAHRVLQQAGVVLHSAGLVFDEKAYIFSGRSNAGKTTLTRKAHKKGARVLSDDINLVLPADSGYKAYAVPFTGEFGRTLNHAGGKESYPVAGIVLLEQSDHLQTLPVNSSAAVARLLIGCPFVNTDEHESDALFDSVAGLVSKVPVIRLLSRKDDDIDDIMAAVKKQFASL